MSGIAKGISLGNDGFIVKWFGGLLSYNVLIVKPHNNFKDRDFIFSQRDIILLSHYSTIQENCITKNSIHRC